MTRTSSRDRLLNAALELFASQGITETTTRQIAEAADVNEVTLFRHFGSKQGLLLAVLEAATVLDEVKALLSGWIAQPADLSQALERYVDENLRLLEQVPNLVRSLIGESGQYPPENRRVLGQSLKQANQLTSEYWSAVMAQQPTTSPVPIDRFAGLLNTLLVGYATLELASDTHGVWESREAFLGNLVALFLSAAEAEGVRPSELPTPALPDRAALPPAAIADLPMGLVRDLFRRAKKSGLQDYALVYVLFGAGLSPVEIAGLLRSQHISDSQQQLLQVSHPSRQVPINRWIMGYRYGSYTRNPLTQWLRSRKDEQPALFLNADGQPMTVAEIGDRWQSLTADLLTPQGQPPTLEQAQQTWRVEMLMKGMSLENLSILTGLSLAELQPYARRAQEKAALEQALSIDQKPGGANPK
ncbi:TetR family transcriptional regulator [Romeria aff. gracilis LEGE 07310]|uniref:TetR family transcriptional regulator n=1 Tax=Vasconcelosia minhoensis LEGE 07310 TaxID=915328 RepID=A0A8J7AT93_9CYAN|nr:TetR/AcrR family transcriptional regulator [Romeria gracilis]MBE9080476.1 TetR family transcriptional regulator [Romeria aff. gracilis LEGE 07310]